MGCVDRRNFVLGAVAIGGSGSIGRSFADETVKTPLGAWSPAASLPYPVQEIYPVAHKLLSVAPGSRKPATRSLIVNAGGFTPEARFDRNITDDVTVFDPLANEWRFGPRLPRPSHHVALVSNSGKLFAIGGFTGGADGRWRMHSDVFTVNDVDAGDWAPIAPLPFPQAETVAVSLAGRVHVVGGRSPAGSLNRQWRDHIDTDRHWAYAAAFGGWIERRPLPVARNSAAGAVFSNALYVIGGRTVNGGNSDRVDVYDPLADRWQSAAPLPRSPRADAPLGRGGLAAAAYGGKIYVFGGEWFASDVSGGGVYADVWEYDPRKDKWRGVAAMPHPRHGLGAVSLEDGVYTIGGATEPSGNGTSALVERFEI